MRTMRGGAMCGVCRVTVFGEAAHVTGDALATVIQLDGAMAGAAPQRFVDECVGSAVEVIGHADVVVDVDPHLFPVGVLVALRRQRLQGGSIETLEQCTTRLLYMAHHAIIE